MRSPIRITLALTALIAITSQHTALSFKRSNANQTGQLKVEQTVNRNNPPGEKKSERSNAKEDDKTPSFSLKKPTENAQLSPKQKKQMAMMLIDGILVSKIRIAPPEYSVLVQVEAATLLWQFDRERSLSILKNAVEAMQGLSEEKSDDKTANPLTKKRQMLRASILRRIARLNPGLLKELTQRSSLNDKAQEEVVGRWTEEARAIVAVAYEKIDQDPALAARLAEQSLSLGLVDIPFFLFKLNSRSPREAEQLAISLMNRLRDSALPPGDLLELRRFVLTRNTSAKLKEYFFVSLAIRLRRAMRADLTQEEMGDALEAARQTLQSAMIHSTNRQSEFAEMVHEFEALFNTRSLPLPASRRVVSVDSSSMNAAEPGDTKAIADAMSDIERISDPGVRDKEYQKLAFQAALKADVSLAEKLLSRIENEELRKQATLRVYSPLVKKSLAESDWLQAQSYAFKVADPIGRTLIFHSIAQSVLNSGNNKGLVNQIYADALTCLDHDDPSENVAKAFFILARTLHTSDKYRSLEAIDSGIYVLNRITRNGKLFEEEPGRAVASWMSIPGLVNQEEALDLNEMLGPLFEQVAKSDANNSHRIALGLLHYGLYSLADLGVAKALLDDVQRFDNDITNAQKAKAVTKTYK